MAVQRARDRRGKCRQQWALSSTATTCCSLLRALCGLHFTENSPKSLVGLNSTTISISFSQSPLSAPARFTHYADCRSARLACPSGQPSYKTSQTMRDDIAPATRNLMTDDQSRSTFYVVCLLYSIISWSQLSRYVCR